MRTAVALGSNLGDRRQNLRLARRTIVDLPGVREPIRCSSIYETNPIGCEPGAPNFLNAVIEFEYDREALELLTKLRQIETALGRPGNHPRNLSRTIDLDLLYVGNTKIATNELQLPHPRMYEREFVLRPLADIRPDLIPGGQTKTVRELLAELSPTMPKLQHLKF